MKRFILHSSIFTALLLGVAAVPAQAGQRGELEANATAAVAAALSTTATAQFRGLDAWIQQPGNMSVCGELATDATPARPLQWHAFFAARGSTGGWQSADSRPAANGWRFYVNSTDQTAAENAMCIAEMRRSLNEHVPPAGPNFLHRCPIEAATFWTDYQMTCAGHPTTD